MKRGMHHKNSSPVFVFAALYYIHYFFSKSTSTFKNRDADNNTIYPIVLVPYLLGKFWVPCGWMRPCKWFWPMSHKRKSPVYILGWGSNFWLKTFWKSPPSKILTRSISLGSWESKVIMQHAMDLQCELHEIFAILSYCNHVMGSEHHNVGFPTEIYTPAIMFLDFPVCGLEC